MGRRLNVDNLVGTAEIAERLGAKSPELVLTWRRRFPPDSEHPFPAPVTRLRIGMVFNWPDVEAWARSTGRL